MRFDSHVETLLAAAVGLVNRLTTGHDGTAPVAGTATTDEVASVLLSQGRTPTVSGAELAAFSRHAHAVRTVFEAADAGEVARAAGLVNALLADTGARPRLDLHDDGWSLHFHGPDDGLVVGWTAGIAAALALCVGSAWAARLGVCAADPCDRVFVDESRNGTRRFCSTRCQNRVKAAAHRRRDHPVTGPAPKSRP